MKWIPLHQGEIIAEQESKYTKHFDGPAIKWPGTYRVTLFHHSVIIEFPFIISATVADRHGCRSGSNLVMVE
jgi:hypothetical protein